MILRSACAFEQAFLLAKVDSISESDGVRYRLTRTGHAGLSQSGLYAVDWHLRTAMRAMAEALSPAARNRLNWACNSLVK